MEGFKLIKTTFESKKEIVGVHFSGEQSYYAFLEEVRDVYSIPKDYEIQVYSTDFIIKPKLFVPFVAQYINNLDFVLDIKVKNKPTLVTESTVPASVSKPKDVPVITEIRQISAPEICVPKPIDVEIPFKQEIIQTPLMLQQDMRQTPIMFQQEIRQTPLTSPTVVIPYDSDNEIPSTMEIRRIPKIQEILMLPTLENKHRTVIAKTIISYILTLKPEKRILREEFLQLAQSIVDIFPDEIKETYYVPFTKGHLSKGKLYDAYNNTRARLSASGIIKRRIKYKSQPTVVNVTNQTNENEIDENHLEILKSGTSDWDSVLEIWGKTHGYRQNELKNENFDTYEYMQKYKVLQHERNYELFEIDFHILYPQSKSIYEWKSYYHKVVDRAKKIKDTAVKDILTNIENTTDLDSKLALSLLLAPYLLTSSRNRSKSDVQECFISYTKNYIKEEDDDTADDSNDSAKRLKLDHEPRVTFVGDYSTPLSFAFVEVYGRKHIFQNPLQAVEICFHCFMALNIKYPKYCEHVWLFIQNIAFQIKTPAEAIIPSITTLINDLQK